MGRYTAGVPVSRWDQSWGPEPSIYDIVSGIPGPDTNYQVPDFSTAATALDPMWIVIGGVVLLMLLAGGKD